MPFWLSFSIGRDCWRSAHKCVEPNFSEVGPFKLDLRGGGGGGGSGSNGGGGMTAGEDPDRFRLPTAIINSCPPDSISRDVLRQEVMLILPKSVSGSLLCGVAPLWGRPSGKLGRGDLGLNDRLQSWWHSLGGVMKNSEASSMVYMCDGESGGVALFSEHVLPTVFSPVFSEFCNLMRHSMSVVISAAFSA